MKTDTLLKWSALLAAMYLSYSAEYGLALHCGFTRYTAPAFPIALDLFMVWSVRQRRNVAASVMAVVAFNVAAHLPLSGRWLTAVTVAASVAAPLIVWAMHVRPRVRVSERRSAIPADREPSDGANGPHVAAERLPESVIPDDLWQDFEDSAPDIADNGPVTPDSIRAAMATLSAAGQRVTGASLARHFGVSERTGRRYLAMAV
ncbi:transfer protein spdA [Streptomyces mirabilis]|uniref:transfer protein spdA n=1 Tax=Streptomyces mirabilis TaxID=68239 RepID=UPI002259A064|nr:transfer protein spdA [Streptomyces mirabilis]MCX4422518.1 helix-turn-helix domain-containing protein [Streptomyces mirabilis]